MQTSSALPGHTQLAFATFEHAIVSSDDRMQDDILE
jgi:hypothetical protein